MNLHAFNNNRSCFPRNAAHSRLLSPICWSFYWCLFDILRQSHTNCAFSRRSAPSNKPYRQRHDIPKSRIPTTSFRFLPIDWRNAIDVLYVLYMRGMPAWIWTQHNNTRVLTTFLRLTDPTYTDVLLSQTDAATNTTPASQRSIAAAAAANQTDGSITYSITDGIIYHRNARIACSTIGV